MKKIALVSTLIISLFFGIIQPAIAYSGRDCDGNAIVRCGTLTVNELKTKINSSSQLKSYYNTIGIKQSQFNKLKSGTVKKDGTVWVGNKKVATNVYSSGRHYIKGSIRDKRFSYPIYWRHPKTSFLSNSLPAFVYLNNDGSFGYAIIKACGNPVTKKFKANIVVEKPKEEVPKTKKYTVTINKFEDKNKSGSKDSDERMLKNFTFTISGKGIKTQWKATDNNGQVKFDNIPAGEYKVQEAFNIKYWRPTTSINGIQYVTVKRDETMWFGNKWVFINKENTYNLTVNKYEDINGNKIKEANEPTLEDFEFSLEGNGVTENGKTDSDGRITFGNLKNGTYTVTEKAVGNWAATSANPIKVTITNGDATIWFGNKRTPVTMKQTQTVSVYKFEDVNSNRKKDDKERMLSEWEFTIKGGDINKTLKTDKNGGLVFTDIPAGKYTITEKNQKDWVSTTTNPLEITVGNQDVIVWFGNKQIKKAIIKSLNIPENEAPQVEVKSATAETLPVAGPKETAATLAFFAMIVSGYYYLRSKKVLRSALVK